MENLEIATKWIRAIERYNGLLFLRTYNLFLRTFIVIKVEEETKNSLTTQGPGPRNSHNWKLHGRTSGFQRSFGLGSGGPNPAHTVQRTFCWQSRNLMRIKLSGIMNIRKLNQWIFQIIFKIFAKMPSRGLALYSHR